MTLSADLLTGEVVLTVKPVNKGFDIIARVDGQLVGSIDCRFGEVAMGDKNPVWQTLLMMTYTDVIPRFRRRGVGTKMRQKAGNMACQLGRKLASDCIRSGFEQAFWDKQLRKGTIAYALTPRDGTVIPKEQLSGIGLSGMTDDVLDDEDPEVSMYEQIDRDEIYVFDCPVPDLS